MEPTTETTQEPKFEAGQYVRWSEQVEDEQWNSQTDDEQEHQWRHETRHGSVLHVRATLEGWVVEVEPTHQTEPAVLPVEKVWHSYRFVNAHAVDRNYGGPEEGGWWYDSGEPLASVPVTTEDEAATVEDRLRAILGPEFEQPHGRNRFSVIGGADLQVTVSLEMARAWPDRRPHYE
jgi:hypothetical protein